MIHDLLTGIGLSDKESAMYMTLLQTGTQTTSVLAKKAGFNRGTAYVVLHNLLEKGLVTKTTRRKVQYFSPMEPEALLMYLSNRKRDIEQGIDNVQSMMGQLAAITNPLTAKPKIEFFDGPDGARMVLEDTLTSKDTTLRAFLSIADIIDFVSYEYFNDYTTRRIESGYTLHAIRTVEKDKKALSADVRARRFLTSRKERREVRYAHESLAFPVTMYLYNDTLAIVSSREEGFALLIKSRELAEMQKRLFGMLWSTLRRKHISRASKRKKK